MNRVWSTILPAGVHLATHIWPSQDNSPDTCEIISDLHLSYTLLSCILISFIFPSSNKWGFGIKFFLLGHASSESHQTLYATSEKLSTHMKSLFFLPLAAMHLSFAIRVFLLGHASTKSHQTFFFFSSKQFTQHTHLPVMSCIALWSNQILILFWKCIFSFFKKKKKFNYQDVSPFYPLLVAIT